MSCSWPDTYTSQLNLLHSLDSVESPRGLPCAGGSLTGHIVACATRRDQASPAWAVFCKPRDALFTSRQMSHEHVRCWVPGAGWDVWSRTGQRPGWASARLRGQDQHAADKLNRYQMLHNTNQDTSRALKEGIEGQQRRASQLAKSVFIQFMAPGPVAHNLTTGQRQCHLIVPRSRMQAKDPNPSWWWLLHSSGAGCCQRATAVHIASMQGCNSPAHLHRVPQAGASSSGYARLPKVAAHSQQLQQRTPGWLSQVG